MSVHLKWPTEKFYWGMIDAPAAKGARGSRDEQLGYLFEGVLPGIPIEDVHAVYARVAANGGAKRYIACALPRTTLSDTIPADTLTLTPEALPESIPPTELEATRLNLLVGPFAPPAVKRLRRLIAIAAIALGALVSVLLALGLEQRARAQRTALSELSKHEDDALRDLLGTQVPGGLPPRLALTAELRQLEQTRGGPSQAADVEAPNAALDLATLLAHWPNELHIQTESIMAVPPTITIRGIVPTMNDAQAFADAFLPLKNPDPPRAERGSTNWVIQQPQSESRPDGISITLRLQKTGGAP